jgi:hypothetical protein
MTTLKLYLKEHFKDNHDFYFENDDELLTKYFWKICNSDLKRIKTSHVWIDFPAMDGYDWYDFMTYMQEKGAIVYSALWDWPYLFYFYCYDLNNDKEYFIEYCEWDLSYYILKIK